MKRKRSMKEVSSRYHSKIEVIEEYLGREGAIDAWARGVSTHDAESFLTLLANEWDVEIGRVRSRNDVFDAIEELTMYLGEETLFQELYYNISDKVAKYLIDGIYRDLDAEGAFEENAKRGKKDMSFWEATDKSAKDFILEKISNYSLIEGLDKVTFKKRLLSDSMSMSQKEYEEIKFQTIRQLKDGTYVLFKNGKATGDEDKDVDKLVAIAMKNAGIKESFKRVKEAVKKFKKPIGVNPGLSILGFGMDTNGNHVVSLELAGGKKKTVQTNQNLPITHKELKGNPSDVEKDADWTKVKKEIEAYVKKNESAKFVRKSPSLKEASGSNTFTAVWMNNGASETASFRDWKDFQKVDKDVRGKIEKQTGSDDIWIEEIWVDRGPLTKMGLNWNDVFMPKGNMDKDLLEMVLSDPETAVKIQFLNDYGYDITEEYLDDAMVYDARGERLVDARGGNRYPEGWLDDYVENVYSQAVSALEKIGADSYMQWEFVVSDEEANGGIQTGFVGDYFVWTYNV